MFGFIRGGNLVRISCRKKCLMRRVDASRRVASMEVQGLEPHVHQEQGSSGGIGNLIEGPVSGTLTNTLFLLLESHF